MEGFAEEEAAKALILMDIVRCPPALLAERMRPMLGWFYNHLARLIYAKAADCKPVDTTMLQETATQLARYMIAGGATRMVYGEKHPAITSALRRTKILP
ncbi:hypothetical protein [Aminobacter sp. Piv2-1]|uniref:hypothetical protein n=1 Tax=Aminobacter sp. Piv2-1 TaxID=3031122 RepID=UPI00309E7947